MTVISKVRHKRLNFVLVFVLLLSLSGLPAAAAPDDATYQSVPFSQEWGNTGLITANDDWSGVPGIVGYRGDNITAATGVDPQTLLADDSPGVVDVNANQTNPNTFTTGGATEFQITNPVVALSGSGTADAPYLLLHINTTGFQAITVAYNVRDIESTTDDAIQQVALHYRTGGTGSYTNVPAAYVADGTTVNTATQVTPVNVTLPAAADNQAMLQLRIMTTNAAGNDEWVGIDDISITGTPLATDLPPTVIDVTPDDGATNQPIDVGVDVTFSEPVTISGTLTINCTLSGVQNVTPTGGPSTFTLPHTNFFYSDVCTVTIPAGQVFDQDGTPTPMASTFSWTFTVTDGCTAPTTPIHTIQGTGSASTLIGQQHTVDGVVIADFQSVSSIRGFYIEEPAADFDADPVTSEGVFIYDNNFGVPVSVGDFVRVTGYVSEFQQQTQISSVSAVTGCGTGAAPAQVVTLPFPDTAYPERFEAMSVSMTQTLTVNENYNLGRGDVLTLANGRLRQPTNVVLPGGPAIALQAANNLNQVVLDDGSLAQNPDPIIYPLPAGLSALNTVRSGDLVSAITGVFSEGGSGWANTIAYRVHPVGSGPVFTVGNPRPAAPDPVRAGGSLRVSSFNVLNYFLTLDTTTNTGPCGPNQNMECRGANTAQELTRQRDKLLQALYTLNADIVGLMELENTPGVEPLADIVAGLNALAGAGTYDYIATGVINPGDVIKVGIIYKPAAVQPVGNFAILNSLVDPNFDTSRHRPTLAQTFQQVSTAGRFTIVVNHLKSKGCTGATGLDADQGDGQSCWNFMRTTGANALAAWLATDPTHSGDPDFLVVGDLNSYAMEDPIRALEGAGYTNLETQFVGANAYSYVFMAQAGSLDHSMANASLLPQVSGATTWHINADEPSVLDYNVEFKSAGQVLSLYNADPYRTSDHDPLLIGLNLQPVDASIMVTKTVGTTPGVCASASSIQVMPGATVYYCYTVANTGNLTLYLHNLEDDVLGSIFASLPYTLTPGSSVNTVAAGLTISATINADTTNTALWTAYNPGPTDVVTGTASATVTLLPPNIVVDPLSMALKLFPDGSATRPMTITNTGGAALDWQIFEQPVTAVEAAVAPLVRFDAQTALAAEMSGDEAMASTLSLTPDPAAHARARQALLATGVLLVPDSTNDRVMALDPATGAVIDPNFIPTNSVVGTGINAILSAAGNTILLSDQTGDVVHEFDLDGNYLGIFAPAGGANNAILNNIRGISLDANGNLLVTTADASNADAVAKFDTNGVFLGNFIATGAGGLNSPFDIYSRGTDWLASSIDSDNILRFDLGGAPLGVFAGANNFPEQIAEAANNNVLVANFGGTQEGVIEYTPAGTLVGFYDPTTLGGYRGVYELPNGNILTTTGTGVHEISRAGALVNSKITGVSARFIEYVAPQTECVNLADIPWVSVSPISGTTASGVSTPVVVTFNAAGLAPGMYTGNLCVFSNDPDPGPGNGTALVIVPVTMTVSVPTAVTLGDLSAGMAQSPAPLGGMPLGVAMPAALSLSLAAAYAIRRKK